MWPPFHTRGNQISDKEVKSFARGNDVYRFVCAYVTTKPKLFHLILTLGNHFKGFYPYSFKKWFQAAYNAHSAQ